MEEHNHVARDVKPRGECPACDLIHDQAAASRTTTTPGERAAVAAEYLIGNGSGPPFSAQQKIDAAQMFGASRSSVERLLGIHSRNQALFEKVKKGEMTTAEASRMAGFIEYRLDRDVPTGGIIFGKGDKFWEAVGPFHRYLEGWENRGFEFSHLPPKEAARRLAKVDKMMRLLEQARADLVVRSDQPRLSMDR